LNLQVILDLASWFEHSAGSDGGPLAASAARAGPLAGPDPFGPLAARWRPLAGKKSTPGQRGRGY